MDTFIIDYIIYIIYRWSQYYILYSSPREIHIITHRWPVHTTDGCYHVVSCGWRKWTPTGLSLQVNEIGCLMLSCSDQWCSSWEGLLAVTYWDSGTDSRGGDAATTLWVALKLLSNTLGPLSTILAEVGLIISRGEMIPCSARGFQRCCSVLLCSLLWTRVEDELYKYSCTLVVM